MSPDNGNVPASLAEQLMRLAAELKAREETESEKLQQLGLWKQLLFAILREQCDREFKARPDWDLETIIQEEGGLPLEAFIDDLEKELLRPAE
jgi:muconolactone delta-isomerase